MTHQWTRPFYGLSHYGRLSDPRRASIQEEAGQFTLSLWARGQGFSSPQESHSTIEAAKAAGEHWVKYGYATQEQDSEAPK